MSNMPSKVNIPVSVPSKTKKFYTQDHVTTHSFMRPRPIFCREYIPNRNMTVKTDSFIRANPMPVPIFGHAKVHNRAFFVPFRAVMPDFNQFYTNTVYQYPGSNAIPTSVPYINNNTLIHVFINSVGGSNPFLAVGSASYYDIVYYDSSATPATTTYYVFTDAGYEYITILESLGYKLNWSENDSFNSSALPLMCYAKVMIDWYYPSAYVGDAAYNYVQAIFNYAKSGWALADTDVLGLLQVCRRITYNPDYFVNAWDNPVGPNTTSVERSIAITDITNNNTYPRSVTNTDSTSISPTYTNMKPTNGTPFIAGSYSPSGLVSASGVSSQYVLDALKSLTDYTKRHQLSGVRALDRYLSEMGINLSAEIMNRSMYLGTQDFDMEFYDVFSHADTESSTGGAPLGAYAGKGTGFSGTKEFSFDNGQEFGMFIVVNSVIPVIGYYQGQHRETMHITALDFYHGDFDHMAVQPISTREVFVTQDGNLPVSGYNVDSGQGLNTTIFGYAPKYIEYNTPQDLQTGLYRCRSKNQLLPCYSLMRDLSFYEFGALSAMKHNVGFVLGNDADQYNRIFYVSKGTKEDQFNAIHHFEVTNVDSTLPAYDTYEFKHEGDEYGGKKVTLDINGSKLN